MSGEILNYTLRLTVLGPLFIGRGEQLQKSEYIFDRKVNKLYVMDKLKMFEALNRKKLVNKFTDSIMDASAGKYAFDLFSFCRDNGIMTQEFSKWARYSFDMPKNSDLRRTQIMTFVKDAYECPYVPGSSVKGALRNAVLNSELISSDNYMDIAQRVSRAEFRKRNNYLSREASEIDIRAFHTLNRLKERPNNAVNSIFSGLRIGDSKPLGLNCLTLCQKVDILPDGTERKLPLQRECLAPGTVIELPVEIDTSVFPYTAEELCRCIEKMYGNENKVFLSKFPKAPVPNGSLIYVGGGSGFVSKTAVYSLYKNPSEALDRAAEILDKTDSMLRKNDGSKVKVGNHLRDPKRYHVSPHMRKQTVYNGKRYDFGLCRAEFEII